MKLQERDFEVLAALERWGVMGLGQVDGMLFHKEVSGEERARLFFNEVRRQDYWGRAYKRLSGLEKLGLVRIRRFPYSWPVYMVTVRGFELLKRRGRTIFESPSQGVSDRLVRHEIAVVGVGLIMTKMLGLPVSTARQVWDFANRRGRTHQARQAMPDLMVEDASGLLHVVEVELTPKSRSRYPEIFSSHQRRIEMKARVLYLVNWPGGVEQITRLAYKHECSAVHAAQLQEFRASLGRCPFMPSYRHNYMPFILPAKLAPAPEAPRAAELAEVA